MGGELTDCIRGLYDSEERRLRLLFGIVTNHGERFHYRGAKAFYAVRDEGLPQLVEMETGICPSYVQIVTALEPLLREEAIFDDFRHFRFLGNRKLLAEGDLAHFRLDGARYDRYLAIEGDSKLLSQITRSVEIGLRKGKSPQGAAVTLKFWDKFDVKLRVYDRLLDSFGEDLPYKMLFTYQSISCILCSSPILSHDFEWHFSKVDGFEDNLLPYSLAEIPHITALEL
jgi:hypothetical protein